MGNNGCPEGSRKVSYANICTNSFFVLEQNDPYPLVKFELYPKNLCDQAFAFTFTSNVLGESLFQLIHKLIDSVIHSFDFLQDILCQGEVKSDKLNS